MSLSLSLCLQLRCRCDAAAVATLFLPLILLPTDASDATQTMQQVPDHSVPVAYNITVATVLDYVYVTRVNA
jgi:hypothetical protein